MKLSLEQNLFLIAAAGLPRAAIVSAREKFAVGKPSSLHASRSPWNSPANLAALIRTAEAAIPRRLSGAVPRKIAWPSEKSVALLVAKLRSEQVALHWREDSAYPSKLSDRLSSPPPWIWLAGEPSRLESPTISIVGSRSTSQPFLAAARKLARALSHAGIAVVSGMADGADSAAHAGAAESDAATQKIAGTIAIPAQGILNLDLAPTRNAKSAWTILGIDRPFEPFTPALAVRRNALIAAMGDALILIASDLQGGSSHAVRWALDNGTPLWCLESGRTTPPANRQLIRANLARPLPIADSPEQWLKQILPILKQSDRKTSRRQSDLFTTAA